ncbi:MAG: hypothetical protein VX679_07825 [Pseudomonadota bacterium]|nr:hypothetical protein [Pseudomonadota bacterium]
MQRAIRLITTSVFGRGHVMLEGDVGIGKTTLLRPWLTVSLVPTNVSKEPLT